MGFLDQSELPEPYFLLEDAAPEPIEENDIDGTMTVDAGGLREIYVSDILAVHGPRIPTPEAERNYAAALIVLTESPASDEMMAAASAWAEAFGGHSEGAQWPSFFELTGGRANMSMRLGERRDPTTEFEVHSIPPAQCSVTAQDCNVGFGCYFPDQAVCLVEGATPMGEECEEDDECAAGMGCGYTPELSSCAPYCNLDDTDMVTGCAVLCPEAFSTLKDPVTDEVTGGRCRAGTGTGICDPLLQDCGEGRGCYGREGNTCRPEGALLRGEICTPTGAVCEAGTTCIGIEGEDAYCMPYCDPTEAGEKACSLLCPGGSWNFGAHDICIPE
jgi:hypothetical protein